MTIRSDRRNNGGRRRALRSRDLVLRSSAGITHIRLGPWRQSLLLGLAGLMLVWLGAASFFAWRHLEDRDSFEAARMAQRLDYFELLAEVSEYHDQFARMTEALSANQDYLLSALRGVDDLGPPDVDAAIAALRPTVEAEARILVSRDNIRRKIEGFRAEIGTLGQSRELDRAIDRMRLLLAEFTATRERTEAARGLLSRRLRNGEQELARERMESTALAKEVEGLQSEIARLETALSSAHGDRADLAARVETLLREKQEDLVRLRAAETAAEAAERRQREAEGELGARNAEIRNLQEELRAKEEAARESGSQRRVLLQSLERLNRQIAGSAKRSRWLERERAFLDARLSGLNERLDEAAERQRLLAERLAEVSSAANGVLARALARTGLPVEDLIGTGSLSAPLLPAGGPYIAGDYVLGEGPEAALHVAMAVLEQPLRRYAALRRLAAEVPLAAPLKRYRVSSGFGPRRDPLNGKKALHAGLDLVAPHGTDILAPSAGRVVHAGTKGRYGKFIEIDHGHGVRTRYGHLSGLEVKRGDEVAAGQVLGQLGSSGRSTGPHLHYEVLVDGQAVDPKVFIEVGRDVFES